MNEKAKAAVALAANIDVGKLRERQVPGRSQGIEESARLVEDKELAARIRALKTDHSPM